MDGMLSQEGIFIIFMGLQKSGHARLYLRPDYAGNHTPYTN